MACTCADFRYDEVYKELGLDVLFYSYNLKLSLWHRLKNEILIGWENL
jgi:hypothetical protein